MYGIVLLRSFYHPLKLLDTFLWVCVFILHRYRAPLYALSFDLEWSSAHRCERITYFLQVDCVSVPNLYTWRYDSFLGFVSKYEQFHHMLQAILVKIGIHHYVSMFLGLDQLYWSSHKILVEFQDVIPLNLCSWKAGPKAPSTLRYSISNCQSGNSLIVGIGQLQCRL